MAEKCTKTSSPFSLEIKPYPFASLNLFTVPCSMCYTHSLFLKFAPFWRLVQAGCRGCICCCTTLLKQREGHYNLENPELSLANKIKLRIRQPNDMIPWHGHLNDSRDRS